MDVKRLLTKTTKMRCPSFSLPAGLSCPREWGDICKVCYAKTGHYRMMARGVQIERLEWVKAMLKDSPMTFVWTMIGLIDETETRYFRIHDSGEFYSAKYIDCWRWVCKELPQVKFFAPTKMWQVRGELVAPSDERLHALLMLAELPNVTVRPSAVNVGNLPPRVPGLDRGVTVISKEAWKAEVQPDLHVCPATQVLAGHCYPCRKCWSKDFPFEIGYLLHRGGGNHGRK